MPIYLIPRVGDFYLRLGRCVRVTNVDASRAGVYSRRYVSGASPSARLPLLDYKSAGESWTRKFRDMPPMDYTQLEMRIIARLNAGQALKSEPGNITEGLEMLDKTRQDVRARQQYDLADAMLFMHEHAKRNGGEMDKNAKTAPLPSDLEDRVRKKSLREAENEPVRTQSSGKVQTFPSEDCTVRINNEKVPLAPGSKVIVTYTNTDENRFRFPPLRRLVESEIVRETDFVELEDAFMPISAFREEDEPDIDWHARMPCIGHPAESQRYLRRERGFIETYRYLDAGEVLNHGDGIGGARDPWLWFACILVSGNKSCERYDELNNAKDARLRKFHRALAKAVLREMLFYGKKDKELTEAVVDLKTSDGQSIFAGVSWADVTRFERNWRTATQARKHAWMRPVVAAIGIKVPVGAEKRFLRPLDGECWTPPTVIMDSNAAHQRKLMELGLETDESKFKNVPQAEIRKPMDAQVDDQYGPEFEMPHVEA